MNRNQMYIYLKDIGMYPIARWRDSKRKTHPKYHIEFVVDKESNMVLDSIVTDWGYIRGFNRIHLFRDELVLESDHEFCKINIKYRNIEKFEVRLFEDEEYLPIP